MGLINPIKIPPLIPLPVALRRWVEVITKRFSYQTYAGDPTGNVTPRWVHDLCLDTNIGAFYWATGLTSSDWEGAGAATDQNVHVNASDGGPYVSSTALNVSTLIAASWREMAGRSNS